MLNRITIYFSKRYLSRWIVLFFDLFVVLITFILAYILRFNFDFVQVLNYLKVDQVIWILPIYVICFWLIKSYSGIIRHSTTTDIFKIISSLGLGGVVILVVDYFLRLNNPTDDKIIPLSVIIIQVALSSLLIISSRLLVKNLFFRWLNVGGGEKRVMIFGAGRLGQIASNALKMDVASNIKIIGFIDDNPYLQNKQVGGVSIYNAKDAFEKIVIKDDVNEIIFAIDKEKLPLSRKREVVDLCLSRNITVKEVPTVHNWLNGELSSGEIRNIKIEDLLGRDSIRLDNEKIRGGLKNAIILIAGAAGSIGSELVRQVMNFGASHVILLDKSESDLYNLQNEIATNYNSSNFTVIVGDVTNKVKLKKVFDKYSPSIVINAAAYKHVPLMEEFPSEAIRVNIGGTLNLADLSVEFGVEKFIMVSTDKAVNPSNVMGASKRICEIYVQSLAQNKEVKTQFITTRFGNVLGSNGSVVPLFKKQIENGGPVTVTHADITRYFMTIPEACQLVLEASFMGKGGEIFVFDMGEQVKIYDLAEKMIMLSGFIPHKDIKIEITCLRPGEKLYEELLQDHENLLPTHNDKILIGKNVPYNYDLIKNQIEHLIENADVFDDQILVDYMREIVPEFISLNSVFAEKKEQVEV